MALQGETALVPRMQTPTMGRSGFPPRPGPDGVAPHQHDRSSCGRANDLGLRLAASGAV